MFSRLTVSSVVRAAPQQQVRAASVCGYNMFVKHAFKTQNFPGKSIPGGKRMPAIAQQWKAMSKEKKAPFVAAGKKIQYKRPVSAYMKFLGKVSKKAKLGNIKGSDVFLKEAAQLWRKKQASTQGKKL